MHRYARVNECASAQLESKCRPRCNSMHLLWFVKVESGVKCEVLQSVGPTPSISPDQSGSVGSELKTPVFIKQKAEDWVWERWVSLNVHGVFSLPANPPLQLHTLGTSVMSQDGRKTDLDLLSRGGAERVFWPHAWTEGSSLSQDHGRTTVYLLGLQPGAQPVRSWRGGSWRHRAQPGQKYTVFINYQSGFSSPSFSPTSDFSAAVSTVGVKEIQLIFLERKAKQRSKLFSATCCRWFYCIFCGFVTCKMCVWGHIFLFKPTKRKRPTEWLKITLRWTEDAYKTPEAQSKREMLKKSI